MRDPSDELPLAPIVTTAHGDGPADAGASAAPEPTLLWIGCSGCSGETQALLGVEGQASDLVDLLDVDGLRLLWHPSLAEQDLWSVYDDLMAGREELTVLCVEGSIALAEDGMFDIAGDVGKFQIVRSLCDLADYVVAMGACAGYGGWQAQPPNPSGAVGLQYTLDVAGGLLPPEWRSRAGLPVITLAGCPVPADTQVGRAALGVERRSRWRGPVRHRTHGAAVPAQHRVQGLRDTAADRAALHGLHRPEVPQLPRTDPWCGGPHEPGTMLTKKCRAARVTCASTGTSRTARSRRRGARAPCTGVTR